MPQSRCGDIKTDRQGQGEIQSRRMSQVSGQALPVMALVMGAGNEEYQCQAAATGNYYRGRHCEMTGRLIRTFPLIHPA